MALMFRKFKQMLKRDESSNTLLEGKIPDLRRNIRRRAMRSFASNAKSLDT